jgi:hypothetical protein
VQARMAALPAGPVSRAGFVVSRCNLHAIAL